jgi:hypothetical protein
MDAETIQVRESDGAHCPNCRADLSQWEHGISIEAAVAAIFADPTLLEPLLIRTCRRCNSRYDWDLVIKAVEAGDGDRAEDEDDRSAIEATQAALVATIREQVEQRPDPEPADVAARIRRELGVAGIFVEDGSEADRRLWGGRGVTVGRPGQDPTMRGSVSGR